MAEKETVKIEEPKFTAKKVVDVAGFFTKENSEKGMWFEPEISGVKIGLKFLVIGAESDEAAEYLAEYDKGIEKINTIEDARQKNEKTREAMATVTSKLVKDIAPGDAVDEIMINGKPLAYSPAVVYTIMYNSVSIADKIIRFSRKDTGFMEKKRG